MLRRLIAANQLLGGVAGIVLFLIFFHEAAASGLPPFVMWACQLFLCVAAAWAGWLLWRDDRRGYRLSLAVQACQLLKFTSPYVAYVFLCGVAFTYTFAPYDPAGKSDIRLGVGAEFPGLAPLSFGVNLIAALSMLWLIRRLRVLQTHPQVGHTPPTREDGAAPETGAGSVVARAGRVAGLLFLAASVGFAGEVPATPAPSESHAAIALLAASGLGSMSSDLNGHPGFGIALQGYLPVAARIQLRPAFEWTGYRVNEYNLASRLLAAALGAAYDDTRVVFRTYRLGLDGVIYLRDRYHGPFLSGGVGVQLSQVSIEDVLWYGGSQEDVATLAASSSTTGLWLGGGAGWRWASSTVEMRFSRAPYRYTSQRLPEGQAFTVPFEARPGWALHLIMGVNL